MNVKYIYQYENSQEKISASVKKKKYSEGMLGLRPRQINSIVHGFQVEKCIQVGAFIIVVV